MRLSLNRLKEVLRAHQAPELHNRLLDQPQPQALVVVLVLFSSLSLVVEVTQVVVTHTLPLPARLGRIPPISPEDGDE